MTRKIARYKGNEYNYYCCPTGKKHGCLDAPTVREADVTESVFATLQAHIAAVASVEDVLAGSDTQRHIQALAKQYDTQIADNERQLEQINRFKSTLYEHMITGVITKADYSGLKVKYTIDENTLRDALSKLNIERDDILAGKSERLQWAERFKAFENISALDRRTVLNLIQSVKIINKTEMQITFAYQSEFESVLPLCDKGAA
ncbi:hypothetical protein FACS1894208_05680 [Clostridia bacterium]|nr:hypothetical protein FACS1894208_05680 [Clostridia bacterium]